MISSSLTSDIPIVFVWRSHQPPKAVATQYHEFGGSNDDKIRWVRRLLQGLLSPGFEEF